MSASHGAPVSDSKRDSVADSKNRRPGSPRRTRCSGFWPRWPASLSGRNETSARASLPLMANSPRSWLLRSLFAGFVAAAVGVGVGWSNYFALPGAMRIDWSAMRPVVVAFGGLCGLLTGLGLGGGMSWAARKDGADVGALRLTVGATVGSVLACTVPATLGIAGFAHVNAPYAGTGNILGSTLLASATFVALFAPSLHREPRLRWLPRLGLAAGASALTATTLGTLVWLERLFGCWRISWRYFRAFQRWRRQLRASGSGASPRWSPQVFALR